MVGNGRPALVLTRLVVSSDQYQCWGVLAVLLLVPETEPKYTKEIQQIIFLAHTCFIKQSFSYMFTIFLS